MEIKPLVDDRHLQNLAMVDKIASVLNKVISTVSADKFATPLRIERDLRYGDEVYPEMSSSNQNSARPRLPPINWEEAMGLSCKSPTFLASGQDTRKTQEIGVNFLDRFRISPVSPQSNSI